MCNCGRTRDVVTSAQVSADIAARKAQDAADQASILQASMANAIGNTGAEASNGWYLTPAE